MKTSQDPRFLIYRTADETVTVEAIVRDDTIWLTQKAMAALFECSVDNISVHLRNIFASGELRKEAVTEKISATASDGKRYLTDCFTQQDILVLVEHIPSRYAVQFIKWFTYSDDTIDGKSRTKAYALYESGLLARLEPGSVKCLQQIHAYLFGGLYDFAGQIRDKNISKGGFQFANAYYFSTILPNIENMPETTFDEIINKYVEMNVAHPFMEGNGRSTRIWLDLMLKRTLKKCIDWSKVNKNAYLDAMRKSVTDSSDLKALLEPALTRKINDREMFMKGIDYSYYYESDDPTLEPDQKEV